MVFTAGLILAGGRSTRMGGVDKAFCRLGGVTLIDRTCARLGGRLSALAINANSDHGAYAHAGLPVVADSISGFQGPLAGILAAMDWAAGLPEQPSHVLTVPVDTPFFPDELVDDLLRVAMAEDAIAMAIGDGGRQPVFAAWPVRLADPLRAFLSTDGTRKVGAFLRGQPVRDLSFASPEIEGKPFDPFFNINSPEDLAIAETMLNHFGQRLSLT